MSLTDDLERLKTAQARDNKLDWSYKLAFFGTLLAWGVVASVACICVWIAAGYFVRIGWDWAGE